MTEMKSPFSSARDKLGPVFWSATQAHGKTASQLCLQLLCRRGNREGRQHWLHGYQVGLATGFLHKQMMQYCPHLNLLTCFSVLVVVE